MAQQMKTVLDWCAYQVDQARSEARRLVDTLLPHARARRWIVGLEPSCLLNLRDDDPALGLGDAARQVTAQCLLLEEFLAKVWKTL